MCSGDGPSREQVAGEPSAEAGNVTSMEVLAKVVTDSDSVAARSRVDRSGDPVEALFQANSFVVVERRVAPDGVAPVAAALTDLSSSFVGLIVTTGCTGFSQTDLTPEANKAGAGTGSAGNGRGDARRQPAWSAFPESHRHVGLVLDPQRARFTPVVNRWRRASPPRRR